MSGNHHHHHPCGTQLGVEAAPHTASSIGEENDDECVLVIASGGEDRVTNDESSSCCSSSYSTIPNQTRNQDHCHHHRENIDLKTGDSSSEELRRRRHESLVEPTAVIDDGSASDSKASAAPPPLPESLGLWSIAMESSGAKSHARSPPGSEENSSAKAMKKWPGDKRSADSLRGSASSSTKLTLFSFGKGIYGELGQGEDVHLSKFPQPVKGLPEGVGIVDVQCGSMHTNVLLEDGRIFSCGSEEYNSNGKLYFYKYNDDGDSIEYDEAYNYTFSDIEFPAFATSIVCGHCFNAALDDQGKVWVWGVFTNSRGEMFIKNPGFYENNNILTKSYYQTIQYDKYNQYNAVNESIIYDHDFSLLKIPDRVTKIASGTDHLLCITKKNHIYSLGSGECGQLGRIGEKATKLLEGKRAYDRLLNPHVIAMQNQLKEITKSGLKAPKIVDIMATATCSFLKDSYNNIYACGVNVFGQTGLETDSANILAPTRTFTAKSAKKNLSSERELETFNSSAENVKSIQSGMLYSLILTETGKVYSCGYCSEKLLGHSHYKYYMDNLDNFSGTRLCMSEDTSKTPKGCCVAFRVDLSHLDCGKIVQIACAQDCNFILDDNGRCFAWGENSSDIIATDTNSQLNRPRPLVLGPSTEIKNIKKIAVVNYAGFILAECK
ncbi:MAG: Regulator of chromosome condensation [Marteilia pararefringens]